MANADCRPLASETTGVTTEAVPPTLARALEGTAGLAAGWLGWHPNFPYSTVGSWIDSRPDARIVERSELPPMKLFTLLRIEKTVG